MAEKGKEKKAPKVYKKPKRYCPRCGAPARLAEHANRWSCGKCGYYEKKEAA